MSTVASIGSIKAYKRTTPGSVITDILGAVDEMGQSGPIVSNHPDAQGKPYYVIVFEDGCRFNLTVGAINYFFNPVLQDGSPNPDYVGQDTLNPGDKFAMKRDEEGRPVIKLLKK